MSISIGMKVYSYCYGPMTVKQVDDDSIIVSVDRPDGFSKPFAAMCAGKDLNNIQMKVSAFGHWYFLSADEILANQENNDFPENEKQSGSPQALIRNDNYLHTIFHKGGDTYPVPKDSDTYPVDRDKNNGGATYPIEKK